MKRQKDMRQTPTKSVICYDKASEQLNETSKFHGF